MHRTCDTITGLIHHAGLVCDLQTPFYTTEPNDRSHIESPSSSLGRRNSNLSGPEKCEDLGEGGRDCLSRGLAMDSEVFGALLVPVEVGRRRRLRLCKTVLDTLLLALEVSVLSMATCNKERNVSGTSNKLLHPILTW